VNPLIAALRGTLVVSCQAYPGEPMRHPETMAQVAESAVRGGASAIRAQGLADISHIAGRVDVPVIGLWKHGRGPVHITPTLRHARAVLDAGADIVAIDATARPRPDGLTVAQTVAGLRHSHPGAIIMGDCGSVDDGLTAADAGVDVVATTLSGYTGDRPRTDGPDLELLAELVAALPHHAIVAEGRIHTPAQASAALAAGAHCVVVGTAITHPQSITGWFAAALTSPVPQLP
jgi:N-acylglucosamine-6-phosphate 2-epimerase